MDSDLEQLYFETIQKLAYSVVLINFQPSPEEKDMAEEFVNNTIHDVSTYFEKNPNEIEEDTLPYIMGLKDVLPHSILIAKHRYH